MSQDLLLLFDNMCDKDSCWQVDSLRRIDSLLSAFSPLLFLVTWYFGALGSVHLLSVFRILCVSESGGAVHGRRCGVSAALRL